jgi:hypothetical protein
MIENIDSKKYFEIQGKIKLIKKFIKDELLEK